MPGEEDLFLPPGECWQQVALCSAEESPGPGPPGGLQVTADLCEGIKACPPRPSSGQR